MNFKSFKTFYFQSLTLYKVVIISFLLLLGVGLGVLWQRFRPETRRETPPPLPKVEISSNLPQDGLGSYSFRASLPSLETAAVYQYYLADGDSKEKARAWAKVLGFAGEPQEVADSLRGTLYRWAEAGRVLIIDSQATNLSFAVDLLAAPEVLKGSFLPTFESAAAIIERTLAELSPAFGGSNLLKFDVSKSEALVAGAARAKKVTVDEADFVEIHFTSSIKDQPAVSEVGPDIDPLVAWVGRDGKLLRLELQVVGSLGEKVGDYPLKSLEEVKEGLEGGEGVVINSTLEGDQEIVSTTITQISLGYLLPEAHAQIIQPIFILRGQARTAGGQTGEVIVYLVALE